MAWSEFDLYNLGGYYGFLLIIEKMYKIPEKVNKKMILGLVYRVGIIFLIISGWVIFRAENINEAAHYFGVMFGFKAETSNANVAMLYVHTFRVELVLGMFLSVPLIPKLISYKPNYLKVIYDILMMFLFFVSISYVVKGTYSPFIYFNF